MFENPDILFTILGGFVAVIGLQVSMRGEIRDNRKDSDEKDEKINEKLASIQREFDLCKLHCKGAKNNE